ncbi:MAG TPA: porin [Sphingomicrobium sp.]|jgi:phosphate-selective porin OprO/OprP
MMTRILLFAGASALALTTPAFAQQAQPQTADDSTLDTLAPADDEQPQAEPAKLTGDPVLDRLNALEARIKQLEARNAQLEQQAELNEGRIESVETRAAKNAQFGWAPTISDPDGSFTFKPRGVIDADFGVFNEREGSYAYNDGTAFRRARLGFEGTAFKWLNYRVEVDFAGNSVGITDAYLQYTKIPKTVLTLGQHKAPFGLESNNSDNYNVFLERGMFTNAFGNAGAERRIGFSAAYAPKENINIAAGLFGDNESISRGSGAAPGESWGVNGRATWEPIFDTGKVLHLGISGFYRTHLKSGDVADAVRLNDRPNVRVDGGNIADSGVIINTRSLRYGGVEAAGVLGALTVAGEAGRLWLDRTDAPNAHFTGFYGYAAYMLTGETRGFKGGNFDRIKPFSSFGDGGLGAFEIALRYDHLNLKDTPVAARAGNEATSLTAGLNWYLNPYAKLMVNYIRFSGDNTPLDPVGAKTKGDAFATRLHLDF